MPNRLSHPGVCKYLFFFFNWLFIRSYNIESVIQLKMYYKFWTPIFESLSFKLRPWTLWRSFREGRPASYSLRDTKPEVGQPDPGLSKAVKWVESLTWCRLVTFVPPIRLSLISLGGILKSLYLSLSIHSEVSPLPNIVCGKYGTYTMWPVLSSLEGEDCSIGLWSPPI